MGRRREIEVSDVSEAFEKLNLETLRPLAKFVSPDAPTRKFEVVPFLTRAMTSQDTVRRLYDSFGDLVKAAIQEAVSDPGGRIDPNVFNAKYGQIPNEGTRKAPTGLGLFFPLGWYIPEELRNLLEKFVPEPQSVCIESSDELPATVAEQIPSSPSSEEEKPEPIELRKRSTAPVALSEFSTMLRLAESGKIRVSDKTRKPSQATIEAVAPFLLEGDFYQPEDRSEYPEDPGSDLSMRAFAWPCILQAAGLVSLSGGKLGLSPAGRKAVSQPPHEGIRAAWNKWIGTSLFDEFERIDAIKGKQSARLSAVADRRRAVSGALDECPPGRWIAIDEFFRFLRAQNADFPLARNVWKLYIAEHYYGHFGYSGSEDWRLLQGRYIMALLFEYAATLGLIDVAYIAPQWADCDYRHRWGSDDYECLSRYDGLMFFRINALGAWCLGLTKHYEPELPVTKKTWKILPNHDVVAPELNPDPAAAMFLDRVAGRTSDRVWRLNRERILTAVEDGMKIDDLIDFLANHSTEPIPTTVSTLLKDLREHTGRLCDKGTVRMIECADAEIAQMLVIDAKLKTLCLLAGERNLVFLASDEPNVRNRLRKLGYVMPLVE